MPRLLVALGLFGLLAPACHKLRRTRRSRAHPIAAAAVSARAQGRYTAAPPGGPSLRVRDGHYLAGAQRLTDAELAAAPWPPSPLVAAAETRDGWLFASADGSVFVSPRFTGPLRLVGSLPVRSPPPRFDDRMLRARAVYSRGALVVLDDTQELWRVGPDGRPRPVPGSRYLDGVMLDAQVGLFVREPGVVLLTRDGGTSLSPLPLPVDAVAYRVALVGDQAWVYTSAGSLRFEGGALVPDPGAPALGPLLSAQGPVERILRARRGEALVLPRDPTQAAMRSDRSLGLIDHEHLTLVDARSGLETEHLALPGSACALYTALPGLRAVCTHGGWARAVFALTPAGGWVSLRDELAGEPMGDLAFDDATPAWAVGAPCARSPTVDPTRLCLYDGRGGRREVTLPFDGGPAAFHNGTLLAVEAARTEGRTRAALLRGDIVTPLDLPFPGGASPGLRFEGDTLLAWEARPGRGVVLHRGQLRPGPTVVWTETRPPEGTTVGLLGPGPSALAFGPAAATLAWSARGGAFVPLPSPVDGHPGAYPLDPAEPSYCVGPRCLLAGSLEWVFAPGPGPLPFLGRREAPPPGPPPPAPWPALRCTHGAPTPSSPRPAGASVSGVGVRWRQTPEGLTMRWEGAVQGTARGPIAPRASGAQVALRLAPGAPGPLGLLERCDDAGCDLVVGTAAGMQAVGLPRGTVVSGSDVQSLDAARALVRIFVVGDGRSGTVAWALDPRTGALSPPRSSAHAAPPEALHPGTLGDRTGLWIPTPAGRMYFLPVLRETEPDSPSDAAAPDGRTPLCRPGLAPTGSLRTTPSPYPLAGPGWDRPALPWRTSARFVLTAAGPCLDGIAGGSADDEAPRDPGAVQSFSLTARDGALQGDGWTASQHVSLRCTLDP